MSFPGDGVGANNEPPLFHLGFVTIAVSDMKAAREVVHRQSWERVKDSAKVVAGPERTPWGSYKFILEDPDGYQIGVTKKE